MKTVDDVLRMMRYGVIPKHRHDRELLMNFADRIEAAVKSLEADRDNWRRQALDEDARVNATSKDSLEVEKKSEDVQGVDGNQTCMLSCWSYNGI